MKRIITLFLSLLLVSVLPIFFFASCNNQSGSEKQELDNEGFKYAFSYNFVCGSVSVIPSDEEGIEYYLVCPVTVKIAPAYQDYIYDVNYVEFTVNAPSISTALFETPWRGSPESCRVEFDRTGYAEATVWMYLAVTPARLNEKDFIKQAMYSLNGSRDQIALSIKGGLGSVTSRN